MLRRILTCALVAQLAFAANAGAAPDGASAKAGSGLLAKSSARKARARRPSAKAYAAMVRDWHAVKPGESAPLDARGRPRLVIEAINLREQVELEAASDAGGFVTTELERVAYIFRDPGAKVQVPIDARLVDLLYALQRRFEAPKIRLVSGYRKAGGHSGSRHAQGQAADIVVPGAKDAEVAEFAKTLGRVGVGIYPRSGYVHVDVREASHYWVDSSGPGQRARVKPRAKAKRRARK
jgi:uncharacterized protein YcbK (DUF882 family)